MWMVSNVRSNETWWSERWHHHHQSTSYFYIFIDKLGDVCSCQINNDEYELQWSGGTRDQRQPAACTRRPLSCTTLPKHLHILHSTNNIHNYPHIRHYIASSSTTLSAQHYLARRVAVSMGSAKYCIGIFYCYGYWWIVLNEGCNQNSK